MKPKTTADERAGLPSASSIERLALCPGSWRMSRDLPGLKNEKLQEYADTGDRVHLYCENPEFIDLSAWPDEQEVAEACLRLRDEVIEKVFGSTPVEAIKEERLWLYGPSAPGLRDQVPLFSGRLDFGCGPSDRSAVLVVDYKSGRGEQAEAASNLQLRTQLVLLWRHLFRKPDKGYTAIVQPLISNKPEICCYDRDQMKAAEAELDTILARIKNPTAPLLPGEKQCKYCPAILKCPAAVDILQDIHDAEVAQLLGIEPKAMAALLDKCGVAETVIKAARAHAKAHLKTDPQCIPGWTLTPNSPTRHIEDAEAAYNAMAGFGMTSERFLKECVSVKIGGLEKSVKAIAESRGEKCSANFAKSIVNTNCAKLITEKAKEPSLERVE